VSQVPEQYATLLAKLVSRSDKTQQEEIAGFERCAREHDEDATLSLRTLRRWMAGHVTSQPRPAQRRVAQLYWGFPMNVLLASPNITNTDAAFLPAARSMAQHQPSPAIPAITGNASPVIIPEISPLRASDGVDVRQDRILVAPPGRFFHGANVPVHVLPAVDDGRILALLPDGYVNDPFLQHPGRRLVVASTGSPDKVRLFGMDTRQVRRRLAMSTCRSRLIMPHAYLIDEITFGVLWAVANLDEALLNDDAILAGYRSELGHFETLVRSAGSRDIAAELTTVSAMWLGSEFCARHILRHLDATTNTPLFWTREQRGEEASTWLLFRHKFDYLRSLADRYPSGMTRTFCIPYEAVERSTIAERVLLLLAVALMESFGIHVQVTPEPEYSSVDGFVLDSGRKGIVANWVGAEGIWLVDVTQSRSTIRGYADACGQANDHTIAVGDNPRSRIRRFADYLSIDWNTTTRRSGELAEYGLTGLAKPRSRLLSLDGVDRACRFLGSMHTASDAA